MERIISLKQVKDWLDTSSISYKIYGDESVDIKGFSSLSNYKNNTVTWIKNRDYLCNDSKNFSLCIIQEGYKCNAKCVIETPKSKEVFFGIIEKFFEDAKTSGIGSGTYIGPNVKIGKNVRIGHNCSLDGNITIGDNTVISNNVSIINKVAIGDNCEIQALCTIGEDGFGYYESSDHIKTMVKHHGGVKIGDNVFIGSHTNIARGTIDDTIIENGVKIAPSTHIGHNSRVGENSTIICAWLFGTTTMGDNSYIVSSVLRNQCSIGDNSMVGMGSVVTKDVPPNKIYIGIPAKEKK